MYRLCSFIVTEFTTATAFYRPPHLGPLVAAAAMASSWCSRPLRGLWAWPRCYATSWGGSTTTGMAPVGESAVGKSSFDNFGILKHSKISWTLYWLASWALSTSFWKQLKTYESRGLIIPSRLRKDMFDTTNISGTNFQNLYMGLPLPALAGQVASVPTVALPCYGNAPGPPSFRLLIYDYIYIYALSPLVTAWAAWNTSTDHKTPKEKLMIPGCSLLYCRLRFCILNPQVEPPVPAPSGSFALSNSSKVRIAPSFLCKRWRTRRFSARFGAFALS